MTLLPLLLAAACTSDDPKPADSAADTSTEGDTETDADADGDADGDADADGDTDDSGGSGVTRNPAYGDILINEIQPHPASGTPQDKGEYFELRNLSTDTIKLDSDRDGDSDSD